MVTHRLYLINLAKKWEVTFSPLKDTKMPIESTPIPEPVPSYFQQRLAQLAITPELNELTAASFTDDYARQTFPIFSENLSGDILIRYAGINGWKSFFKGKSQEAAYVRTRLHPSRCTNGMPKYLTPRGAGTEVFFPPMILEAYHQGTELKTLVVTEGEFKAFKACMHGLACVGVQGIHNTHEKDPNGGNTLNTELQAVIRQCQVKNLIFLLDNDCLTVEYDEDKDLAKRPTLFYSAVRNFREYTKHLECDVYFAHLNPERPEKGIDDLFCEQADKVPQIVEELLKFKLKNPYFFIENVTDKSLKKLKSYFGIDNAESFYSKYEEVLTDKKFRFNGYFYQYNGLELKRLVSDAINNFVRIGDDYYEAYQKPNKEERMETVFDKRKKVTITDDYGKDAHLFIKRYKGFCLVPSHHNYRREINQCYNTYYPLSHQPQAGSYENSLNLLKHIFGDKLEFALDYMQLLYQRPAQLLPILLLQSKERETGKSTFGQWLRDIFESNSVKLGNADLQGDFNSAFVEKLLIVVDETSLEKKATSEAIKRMSTEVGKVIVKKKSVAEYETDWIGKFVFCTNNVGTSLYIGKGETRYAVFTVPPFPKEKKDPHMQQKLREEIPAFLHFLLNRELHYPQKGRMYFDFEVYKTNELDEAIDANISVVEREIRNYIQDCFDTWPYLKELSFTAKDLADELKDNSKFIDRVALVRSLKNDLEYTPTPTSTRYQFYSLKAFSIVPDDFSPVSRVGKCYCIHREIWETGKVQIPEPPPELPF
ncbi:DUF5906 domain-containing protein [Runella zeae]|uniref:DUF5906 domain-containing protein n=1 Tax=Runella zeae TaxID=94255 RepID=UPI0003F5739C|nr:DUF5906 domain-containing protein [Runella zeae]